VIGDLVYSVEVAVVHCPGDGEAGANPGPTEAQAKVRYCDLCRRWGTVGSTHLCGRNWHRRLSDLLIALSREVRR
jgi:hypothetical protein